MISIVICSRDPLALKKVTYDIGKTIGVLYEIIEIDNSKGDYNICEAYNFGASKAIYEILCFMHEDIKFHSIGWGEIIKNIFSDSTIGIIGVAGSTYQVKSPVPWWFLGDKYNRMQVLHALPGEELEMAHSNPNNERLTNVAVVDGLWICTRKHIWERHKFDGVVFNGFHFYDMDFCAQVFPHYKICVCFDILIEHFSKGTIDLAWVTNVLKYQKKHRSLLPFGSIEVSEETNQTFERDATYDFLKRLIEMKMPKFIIFSYIIRLASYGLVNRQLLSVGKRILAAY